MENPPVCPLYGRILLAIVESMVKPPDACLLDKILAAVSNGALDSPQSHVNARCGSSSPRCKAPFYASDAAETEAVLRRSRRRLHSFCRCAETCPWTERISHKAFHNNRHGRPLADGFDLLCGVEIKKNRARAPPHVKRHCAVGSSLGRGKKFLASAGASRFARHGRFPDGRHVLALSYFQGHT